jgi:hypothetical protein
MITLKAIEGFIITFEALSEDIDMYDHFILACEWTPKQYAEIENFAWFTAKVSAWKNRKEIASEYLGTCCYETIEEFYTTHKEDYLAQMVANAVLEAKNNKGRARII